jgi:hypothetical protein
VWNMRMEGGMEGWIGSGLWEGNELLHRLSWLFIHRLFSSPRTEHNIPFHPNLKAKTRQSK